MKHIDLDMKNSQVAIWVISGDFDQIVEEDNQNKIGYLHDQIQHALRQGNTSVLEGIKRLPWTKKVLAQAKRIAIELFQGKVKGKAGRKGPKPQ